MKRAVVATVMVAAVLVMQTGMLSAAVVQSQPFILSASIAKASSVSITATKAWTNAAGDTEFDTDPMPSNALSFDPMEYKPDLGIFLPNHFFAVDVSPNGAGSVSTQVKYSNESNPAGATKGLGDHATATFVKSVYVAANESDDTVIAKFGKKALKNLDVTVAAADVTGGWLRVYIGIATGDTNAVPADPAGVTPFTATDAVGPYMGTVTFTATLS